MSQAAADAMDSITGGRAGATASAASMMNAMASAMGAVGNGSFAQTSPSYFVTLGTCCFPSIEAATKALSTRITALYKVDPWEYTSFIYDAPRRKTYGYGPIYTSKEHTRVETLIAYFGAADLGQPVAWYHNHPGNQVESDRYSNPDFDALRLYQSISGYAFRGYIGTEDGWIRKPIYSTPICCGTQIIDVQ